MLQNLMPVSCYKTSCQLWKFVFLTSSLSPETLKWLILSDKARKVFPGWCINSKRWYSRLYWKLQEVSQSAPEKTQEMIFHGNILRATKECLFMSERQCNWRVRLVRKWLEDSTRGLGFGATACTPASAAPADLYWKDCSADEWITEVERLCSEVWNAFEERKRCSAKQACSHRSRVISTLNTLKILTWQW